MDITDMKIYGYASLRTGHTKDELKKNFEIKKNLTKDEISQSISWLNKRVPILGSN